MMLDGKIKAIRRKLSTTGVWGTLKLIVDHVMTRILHRKYLLFYVDIATYSTAPEQLSKDVCGKHVKSIEDLSSKDVLSIKDYAGTKYVDELKKHLENNWSFFLAYVGDNVAGGGWAICHSSEFKTKVVPVLENDIVLIDYFTFPQFRGRNVYPFLLAYIINHFRQNNKMRAFISVNEKNAASIKGIQKAGFRHVINYESYTFRGSEVVVWRDAVRKETRSESEKRL